MTTETGRRRVLGWDGCPNSRDLGGYPTHDGTETRWGAIVRSDNLTPLTETGRRALVAYGVQTIIDLRGPREVADLPNPYAEPGPHGVAYANVPFESPAENLDREPDSLAIQYRWMLDTFQGGVATILTAIARAPAGGVLIHCMGGKDRTGLIAALLLDLAGVERAVISEDYALTTECLRARDDAWLASAPQLRAERARLLAKFEARAEVMIDALDHLDRRYGGVAPYLTTAGVAPDDIASVRRRLLTAPND